MGTAPHLRPARTALAADALASLVDHLAVIDRGGTILAVNDAWNAFGVANGVSDVASIGPGVNYLEVCARAAKSDVPRAAAALEGIDAVCSGRLAEFELQCPCDGPFESSCFLMTVRPLRHEQGGAVVSHRQMCASTSLARKRAMTRLAGIRLRQASGHLATREDERRNIARELHDDVNQRLALLAIGIEQVGRLSGDKTVSARLHDLWVETTRISTGVHALSHALHSSTLGPAGLVPAVRTLSRDLLARGLRVTVSADDRCGDLPETSALCLFRIAQQALTNVLTHSGVREATVTLTPVAGTVVLCIKDCGRGFDPRRQRDGLGLLSMRERAALVGGTLRVRSSPREGTVIEARVPQRAPHAAVRAHAPTSAA